MVDTFKAFERKFSLPMEIPDKRSLTVDIPRRKVSNPINIHSFSSKRRDGSIENKFCYNSRNSALVGSGGEENSYILLSEQSTNVANLKIGHLNYENRTTKAPTVSTKPYMSLNMTKKKKSSSGVSSSSDDSNFQHQLGIFQDTYRKRSDESLEEISSLSSSPQSPKKTSHDNGKKKIDLGYYSPKIKNSSSSENFHSAVSKKLSNKEKKESLIGLFEQISTAGIQESKATSIYEFRKNKRRSAIVKNLQDKGNFRKRLSMPNSTTEQEESSINDEDKRRSSLNPPKHINENDKRRSNSFQGKTLTDILPNTTESDDSKKNVSSENISSQPPQRKISTTSFEPRRRVSSMTLEELNIINVKKDAELNDTNYHKDTSKELSELLGSSIAATKKPMRRFSSHIPSNYNKLLQKTEPKRRFSSALPCVRHEFSSGGGEYQQPSFQELQSRFSELFSPNNTKEIIEDVSEEREYDIVSTIDKTNNIFVAQIENEKSQSMLKDIEVSECGDVDNLVNQSNSSTPIDDNCRRYSYNPPGNIDTRQPVRRNNSLDLPNERKARRTSLTALQNVPWGDKRLSREAQIFNRQKTIDECAESIASSKDQYSDDTSTISTLSTLSTLSTVSRKGNRNKENQNLNHTHNIFTFSSHSNNEMPVSADCRISLKSVSLNGGDESSDDESDSDDQAMQRPSVIHRPIMKIKNESAETGSDTSTSDCNYRTLKEVNNRILGIGRPSSIVSSIDSDYPDNLSRSRSTTATTIDEPIIPAKERRRKYGITHITALENIPKRRISVMQEYAFSDRGSCDEQDSYLQENSLTRKFSTYAALAHPLVTFQDERDTEVLSDQKTIDVIFDSLDALSSVESPSSDCDSDNPFPSMNNLHEPFRKTMLPNLDEEMEFDSPSWCLERKKKQLGIFKEEEDLWTPTESTNSCKFIFNFLLFQIV